jgi:hypothetical protein
MGTLLRNTYEVRDPEEYFDDIQDVKVTKDVLDLARHVVEQKAGRCEPGKFEGPVRNRPRRRGNGQALAIRPPSSPGWVFASLLALRLRRSICFRVATLSRGPLSLLDAMVCFRFCALIPGGFGVLHKSPSLHQFANESRFTLGNELRIAHSLKLAADDKIPSIRRHGNFNPAIR